MTPLPSTALPRTRIPSPLLRRSQPSHLKSTPKRSKPTTPTTSTNTSTLKTSNNLYQKKQPCSKAQKSHRRASQDIPPSTYIPFATVQARVTTTKSPTTTTMANARAKTQPSRATMSFPLTLGFGTFITARISPLGVVGRAGIAWGVGCA